MSLKRAIIETQPFFHQKNELLCYWSSKESLVVKVFMKERLRLDCGSFQTHLQGFVFITGRQKVFKICQTFFLVFDTKVEHSPRLIYYLKSSFCSTGSLYS